MVTKEPAQYIGDEAAREVPGRPEPVPSAAQGSVNLRILVLALATFAIGTGTFIVAGLLGGVARDLSVSVGTAGHLVTVFAVAYAVLSPFLAAAVCTPVALATAACMAPPERKGRALSVTIGGISVAWVVGVPLGA
ncbi:MAG TPA: hypothetical protein VFG82_03350, partial [Rubrobacter sp.]|nr:hypothetical protein [Rubrobacter sp.]